MRGRRGHASSSVSQEQLGMALRNQAVTDAGDVPCGSQQTEESTQQDDMDELSCSLLTPSSPRDKRRRERENRSKPREMTEEEMMDLALRLSEQEASRTALRLQREEEAVMSAIRESMVGQTQPCPPSHSLVDAESSLRSCSRRKLSYSNGKPDESEDDCTQTELHSGKRRGAEIKNQHNKRKRKEGSPLQEMPDLSQTQKIQSQASSCGSETPDLPLDSPQSVDSTQIDDCAHRKSPVFPATGCRVEVHVSRLSQDLLQTCRTSGFVLCSQGGWTSPPTSPLARPRSPTFPSSRRRCADLDTASPKSSVSSEAEQGGDGALSPEPFKSPVFGRSSQQETSPSACRPQVSACTSGFTLGSHESLSSSVRSCPTHRPVFTRTPGRSQDPPPPETSEAHRSADISEAGGQSEKSPEISRVHAARPPPADDPSRLRQVPDSESDPDEDLLLQSDEELKEVTEEPDSAERELTSDMTLLWSDEDDDVTPVVSPSPVFPDERPLNHVTAAAPVTNCRSSTGQPQREQEPIRSQGASGEASAPPGAPASGPMVHYYWGVPFCPRGLDPDRYTQVILAQMEVYEKSLKQAQRHLLRKAEWGEAVLPQPEKSPSPESPADSPEQLFTHRHGLRLRGRTLCDEAEMPLAEDEEEGKQEEEEEKKNEGEEETQVDDCEVCPETQMSDNDRTQDLMTDAGAAAQCPQLPPESPEPPEVQIVVRDDSPAGGEQVEVGETCQTEGNVTGDVRGEEGGGGPDVEEVKDGGPQTSPSPDPEPAVVPQSPETSVDCPICQGSFPVTQIELHAAYCDGEVAVVDERKPKADGYHVSPKPRRRRRRRVEAAADDTDGASNTARNQEKCFICQREVPLREYSRHTELCIQRQAAKTSAKGNLLSALEETESRDSEAGTSGSKPPPGDVIDLRDDDDEEDGGVSAVRISNSPIRSFTPISEATGCLIDFKKQQRPKKLSHRRR